MHPIAPPASLTRREALRRIFVAASLAASLDLTSFGADEARGLGLDPDLLKKEIPWPRLMTAAEKRTTTALADLIIPADEHGPAASAVGVADFIDEWISAPYDTQRNDRDIIRPGLAWLEAEATSRHGKPFADTSLEQQTALVEDILVKDSAANRAAYRFWKLFRDRACGGYFSTPEGWKALGYTGNVPLMEFPGATPEALKHIGLA
jgi:hypothetical protein